MKLRLVLALATLLATGAGAESLKDLADSWGARVFYDPSRGVVLMSSNDHHLVIDLATGQALGDGTQTLALDGLDPASGSLSAPSAARLRAWWKGSPDPEPPVVVSTPVQTPPGSTPSSSGRRLQVLVLDAGHGGLDPGSLGRHTVNGESFTLKEKDLTLAVVLELRKLLEAAYPDRTIVLTRDSDTYPTLEKRVQIAHNQKLADDQSIVFLSVHFNASLNRQASGLELWYVPKDYERDVLGGTDAPDSVLPMLNLLVDSEYKKESRQLAEALAGGLATELGDDSVRRGLKENPWFVVRMARMPAVLAELGFITNPDEAQKFRRPEYLQKLAHGLYNGVVSFIKTYEDPS